MTECCPHCGGELWPVSDQVAAWVAQCADADLPLIASRVSERTAAVLLGVSERKLAELRKRGCGPRVSLLPVCGSRYSYELAALARFKAAHQSGEDWV
jgi:hypothetical protein